MRMPVLIAMMLLLLSSAASAQPAQDSAGAHAKNTVSIEITGLSSDMLSAAESGLSIYQQRDHPLLNSGLVRQLHAKAPAEIRRALQPFGYYRPHITAQLDQTAEGWNARYEVEPGDPVRVHAIDINITGPGASEDALQRWRTGFPLHVGDALIHKTYEDAKQDLLDTARDLGYFAGRLERHEVTVDLRSYSADIQIDYITGPRYAFGRTSFDQDLFAEAFLRRYLTYRQGYPYDVAKLLELQRALSDSDYFDHVQVEPQIGAARDQEVPIRVSLIPRNRLRYDAGIGYTTDTGPRGTLGFQNRRATSYGHRYGIVYKGSSVLSSANATYIVPLRRPRTDNIAYTAEWVDENTDTLRRTTNSLSADLTRMRGPWKRGLGISYERERYHLNTSDDSTLLIPRSNWQRVWGLSRIHTRNGALFNAEVRGAAQGLVSDTTFLQLRTGAKLITGIGKRDRILLRAQGGASWVPAFTELPASQRFFAGGDQSIRGYAYKSLGPTDDTGTVIGGRHLAVASVEYEHPWGDIFSTALFYDAGNAFNTDAFTVMSGAGFGLRWHLPFGAIRIDIANAISKPGHPWRLHITMGPDL